jgi:hypothetical protein
MIKCAADKNIDFCVECKEYPCAELKEFQAKMPHRIELWDSLKRIKAAGYKAWYTEMIEHYSCPKDKITGTEVQTRYAILCHEIR